MIKYLSYSNKTANIKYFCQKLKDLLKNKDIEELNKENDSIDNKANIPYTYKNNNIYEDKFNLIFLNKKLTIVKSTFIIPTIASLLFLYYKYYVMMALSGSLSLISLSLNYNIHKYFNSYVYKINLSDDLDKVEIFIPNYSININIDQIKLEKYYKDKFNNYLILIKIKDKNIYNVNISNPTKIDNLELLIKILKGDIKSVKKYTKS